MLKGSEFANFIRHFRRELEVDYDLISRNVPNFSTNYTLQEFLETYKSVQSRMLGLTDHEKDMPIDAMVPIADFFNHEWPPGIKWAYT